MDSYDVAVAGGGIAGSVAAKFAARRGLSTLLIEKSKTPRDKACSGIQFPYLEKLVGEKAPREVLCANELFKVDMEMPNGRSVKGGMRMLNFWRSTFDSWLNSLAVQAGACFHDETRLLDFDEDDEGVMIRIMGEEGERSVRARYLIAADGMSSAIRRKLRPEDFRGRPTGATINYYFVGDAKLDPNTLYMFYSREFSPLMFAWAYLKDDRWVIGTGADQDLLGYAGRFLSYVQEKYSVTGEMVKKEGFTSPMESTVYLGKGNILLTGDAAGLVDMYRGLGMDNAALSGRLAVKAIARARQARCRAIGPYRQLMEGVVGRIERNNRRQAARYATNETLERSLSTFNVAKDGMLMLTAAQVNRVLPPERVMLLPL